jgi:hypothetical protein
MFGAPVRAAERRRGLRFTEFELRQIVAVRADLDPEYEASITRSDRSSQPRFPANPRLDQEVELVPKAELTCRKYGSYTSARSDR